MDSNKWERGREREREMVLFQAVFHCCTATIAGFLVKVRVVDGHG